MAKNDELEAVLNHPLLDEDDWQFLCATLSPAEAKQILRPRRTSKMNVYVRHSCYGHMFANVFRDAWSPDYHEIVSAVAGKLKIEVRDRDKVEDLETKILQQVLKAAKEKFIREKGIAEWEKIEQEAQQELEKLAKEGRIPQADVSHLRDFVPGGVIALIAAGRLSGITVYLLANKLFFAISRTLGLGIGVAVAGPIIGKVLSFLLGPSGWILSGIWFLYDIGDTNWRKTIPIVVTVALLRRRLRWKERDREEPPELCA